MIKTFPLKHDRFPLSPTLSFVPPYRFYNYELGMYCARDFFTRVLEMSLDAMVHFKTWTQELVFYNEYHEDVRGAKAYFALDVATTFVTSNSRHLGAFGYIMVQCGSEEYLWTPNFYGTYFTTDGKTTYEVEAVDKASTLNLRPKENEDFQKKLKEVWPTIEKQVEIEKPTY